MSAPTWWVDSLARVAYGIRENAPGAPTWDPQGIRAVVSKLTADHPLTDVAVAMVRGAANPKLRTPAGVGEPGPQWTGTAKASSKQPTRCPAHPKTLLRAGTCPECEKHLTRNRPANFQAIYDQARAQARQDRARAHQEAMNHD